MAVRCTATACQNETMGGLNLRLKFGPSMSFLEALAKAFDMIIDISQSVHITFFTNECSIFDRKFKE